MKKIVFVHKSLVVGGAERILLNYLKMFGSYRPLLERYQVSLVLHEPVQNPDLLAEIPSHISVSVLLSQDEVLWFDEQEKNQTHINGEFSQQYVKAYQTHRTRLCERMIQFFGQSPVDCVVNFNTHFDFFLERYTMQIPVIRWIHGLLHFNLWQDSAAYYQKILNQHRAIIALNDEMKALAETIFAQIGVQVPVYRLYNPIDLADIAKKSQILPACTADLALLNQPFLLQVARLEAGKNHRQLIDIFAQLKAQGLPHKLYIIGKGELHSPLSQYIEMKNLSNDCFLLGERVNPYPFMRCADLFVHSSLAEGLPTVLIESMACGTPVVAMNCQTGVKEILGNGKFGGLVELGDEIGFVRTVFHLLTKPDKHTDFISKIPQALAPFDVSAVQSSTLAIFQEIVDSKSSDFD